MIRTPFTDLTGCRVPLQLSPMSLVSPDLATAVAKAGALPMLNTRRVSVDYLVQTLDRVASSTGTRPGVNFLVPFVNKDVVKAVAPHAAIVDFFFGDPDPALVELAHAGGALASWQVGSREEAVAAERAGCDLMAAQGIEAGGHVRGSIGLFPLLGEVLDTVRIPVIASGGIGTARSMAAALAAGAAAVRVGTRFLAAQESSAHPAYVEALIRARAEDTVITETFHVNWPDAPHRVLRSCIDAANAFKGELVGKGAAAGEEYPIPRFTPPSPNRATVGEISAMALYAGQSVNAVRRIQPAAEIVRELSEGAEQLLRACTSF